MSFELFPSKRALVAARLGALPGSLFGGQDVVTKTIGFITVFLIRVANVFVVRAATSVTVVFVGLIV